MSRGDTKELFTARRELTTVRDIRISAYGEQDSFLYAGFSRLGPRIRVAAPVLQASSIGAHPTKKRSIGSIAKTQVRCIHAKSSRHGRMLGHESIRAARRTTAAQNSRGKHHEDHQGASSWTPPPPSAWPQHRSHAAPALAGLTRTIQNRSCAADPRRPAYQTTTSPLPGKETSCSENLDHRLLAIATALGFAAAAAGPRPRRNEARPLRTAHLSGNRTATSIEANTMKTTKRFFLATATALGFAAAAAGPALAGVGSIIPNRSPALTAHHTTRHHHEDHQVHSPGNRRSPRHGPAEQDRPSLAWLSITSEPLTTCYRRGPPSR